MAAQQDVAARLLAACGSHQKLLGELAEQLADAEKQGSFDESPPAAWQGVKDTFEQLAKEFAIAQDGSAARIAARVDQERSAAEQKQAAEAAEKEAAEKEAAEKEAAGKEAATKAAAAAKAAAAEAESEERKRAAETAAKEAAAQEAAAKEAAAAEAAATVPPAPDPVAAPAPAKSSLFGGAQTTKSSLFGGAPKSSLFANATEASPSYGTSAQDRLRKRMQQDDSDDEDKNKQDLLPVESAAVAPGPDKWSVKAQAAAKVEKPKIPALHTGMDGTYDKDESGNWIGTGVSALKPPDEAASCVLKLDSSPEGEFDKSEDGNWVKRGPAMQNIT